MSDDALITMRAEVRRFLPGRDTREVIEAIERVHGPNRWSRKSIIVACSQLRTYGSFSQAILPDGAPAPLYTQVTTEERKILEAKAQEVGIRAHDVVLRAIRWLIDEDLLDICPTLAASV